MHMTSQVLETVSVIVPVYNSGNVCVRAIESVLEQTHFVSEIIVVDDGSSDESAKILRNHFYTSAVPIQIHSIVNRGAAGARNFGLTKATSAWVAFLDSDDAWAPRKTEAQFEVIRGHPSLCLIGSLTNMQVFSRNRSRKYERVIPIFLYNLLFKNYFQTSTVIAKRDVLVELGGFPEGRRYAEEGDLFMRIAARHHCFLLNEVLVDYAGGKPGFGVAGLSANLWRMEQGEITNIVAVWRRRDAGFWITAFAFGFSILKFIRRLLIRLFQRLIN